METRTDFIEKFRIEPSVKKKLKEMAKKEDRTLIDFIRIQLKKTTKKSI